ncbi:hypothetical protein TYRP_005694 [Tyrophagus putrescentiae]|nr:hypothetical protein TYRP_005694 [Tyrophagus putrescentiae]
MQLMAACTAGARYASGGCSAGSGSGSASGNGLRSLVCDSNGIIIAEAVTSYRCMICADVFEQLGEMHLHYRMDHMAGEFPTPTATATSTYSSTNESMIHSPVISATEDYEDPKFEMAVAAEAMAASYCDPYDGPEAAVNNGFNNQVNYVAKKKNLKKTMPTILSSKKAQEALLVVDPAVKVEDNLKAAVATAAAKEGLEAKGNNKVNGAHGKGGFVTCEVCDLTRYYSHISRRYGVFSCESCAKFFYRYSQKPVKYSCVTGTGHCQLNITLPGSRCKACLLEACFKKYILDPKKHAKIFANGEPAIFSPLAFGSGEGGKGVVEVNNNNEPLSSEDDQKETAAFETSLLKQQLSSSVSQREPSPVFSSSSSVGDGSSSPLKAKPANTTTTSTNILFTTLKAPSAPPSHSSGSKTSVDTTTAAAFPFSAEVLSHNPKKRKSPPATTITNELTSSNNSKPPPPSANKQLHHLPPPVPFFKVPTWNLTLFTVRALMPVSSPPYFFTSFLGSRTWPLRRCVARSNFLRYLTRGLRCSRFRFDQLLTLLGNTLCQQFEFRFKALAALLLSDCVQLGDELLVAEELPNDGMISQKVIFGPFSGAGHQREVEGDVGAVVEEQAETKLQVAETGRRLRPRTALQAVKSRLKVVLELGQVTPHVGEQWLQLGRLFSNYGQLLPSVQSRQVEAHLFPPEAVLLFLFLIFSC